MAKGTGRELVAARAAISGAAATIVGTTIVADHSWAGHAVLVCGLMLFGYGARLPTERRQRLSTCDGSRLSIVGLALCGLAAANALWIESGLVLLLWGAGLGALVAAALRAAWQEARQPRWRGAIPLVAIASLSAVVNLTRLTEYPGQIHGDLGEIALKALELDAVHDLFKPSSWYGLPGMFLAIQRLGLAIDDGLFGARLPDAVTGILTNVFVYLAVSEMADRRTACLTAILAAGSASLINTWRSGMMFGAPVLLPLVAVWALLRAVRSERHARDFFLLAGVAAGIAVQVYVPARIVPFLLTGWVAHELVFGHGENRRRIVRGFAWVVVAALVVAGPLLLYYASHPESMLPRSERTIFAPEGRLHSMHVFGVSSMSALVWNQAIRSLGMFHFYPSADGGSFLPNRGGYFEPLTAGLFLLGAVACALRPGERRCAWPLYGCGVSLLLVIFTVDPPSYSRVCPAAGMALLVVGIGCAAIFEALQQLTYGWSAESASRSARSNQWILDATAALIGCVGLAWGTSRYFLEYCQKAWLLSASTAVARRLSAEPAERTFTYLLTEPVHSFDYGNIRFVARGHRGKDLPPGTRVPPELVPGRNLFIAVPGRATELRELANRLPPGDWEEIYKTGAGRELELLVLRIDFEP